MRFQLNDYYMTQLISKSDLNHYLAAHMRNLQYLNIKSLKVKVH